MIKKLIVGTLLLGTIFTFTKQVLAEESSSDVEVIYSSYNDLDL